MGDLRTSLSRLAERGVPVGAEEMIERVEADMASTPLIVVEPRRREPVMTQTDQRVRTSPARPPRGVVWAMAAFTVIAVTGAAITLFLRPDRETRAASDVATVQEMFRRWNAGDVDGAMELIDPGIRVNGMAAKEQVRGLMEFASELGGRQDVTCRPASSEGDVTCSWKWLNPVPEAMGLPGRADAPFHVADGVITAIGFPDYSQAEYAYFAVAKADAPDGWSAACEGDGLTGWCGSFLRSYQDLAVASATVQATVGAFFGRWNTGDTSGAMDLVDPAATVDGTASPGDLRGLIEFRSAFAGREDVSCAHPVDGRTVSCMWRWATPGVDAMGLPGATVSVEVVDGRIETLDTPDYGAFEGAIEAFARERDPSGLAAACDHATAGGFHDSRCGAFLAGFEAAFAAAQG